MNFWVNIKLYFIVYAKLKINLISIFDEFCLFEQFFWDNNWQISHIKIMRVEKKIKKANKFQFVFVSIASSFVGLINGLLGAGGGSLVVPIYESGMKLEAKKAHATAIATMLPSGSVSGILSLLGGTCEYWRCYCWWNIRFFAFESCKKWSFVIGFLFHNDLCGNKAFSLIDNKRA